MTRFLVNDPTTAASQQFTDQEVQDAINQAYFEILGTIASWSTEVHIKTSAADTVADQQLYALPTDFGYMKEVIVDYDGNNLLTSGS